MVDGERKDIGHISHDNNNGLVKKTQAPQDLKPLRQCACSTITKNKKCSWCVIVARVGYDLIDCK